MHIFEQYDIDDNDRPNNIDRPNINSNNSNINNNNTNNNNNDNNNANDNFRFRRPFVSRWDGGTAWHPVKNSNKDKIIIKNQS